MFQLRTTSTTTEPNEAISTFSSELNLMKSANSETQTGLARLQSEKASAGNLALLTERVVKLEQITQQQATALSNFETSLKTLINSTSNAPSTPGTTTTSMEGWVRFDTISPSFQLDLYKTSDSIQITDNHQGARCFTDKPSWQDIVVFRDFAFETRSRKTLYLSFKMDSVDASNHLFGIGDVDFDFNKLSNAYNDCVVAANFSELSLRQQHRVFGNFGSSKSVYGAPLPVNGGQVTLKIKPALTGGIAEISLYQTTANAWDITSSSFRIFHTTLPDTDVPATCYPWWIVYGGGAVWLSGIKIE